MDDDMTQAEKDAILRLRDRGYLVFLVDPDVVGTACTDDLEEVAYEAVMNYLDDLEWMA